MRDLKKKVMTYFTGHLRTRITVKDLARHLKVNGKEQFKELRSLIDELERTGVIDADERGRFGYVVQRKKSGEQAKPRAVTGRLSVTRRGLGFVRAEGFEKDIRIASKFQHTALSGDLVEISLFARPRTQRRDEGPEGEVVRVVERTDHTDHRAVWKCGRTLHSSFRTTSASRATSM